MIIYSNELKIVYIIELTCSSEDNFAEAEERKIRRDKPLVVDIELGGIWKAKYFTVEVGVRGFYNNTVPRLCNALGFTKKMKTDMCNKTAEIGLKASYTIWLSRKNQQWSEQYELVQLSK